MKVFGEHFIIKKPRSFFLKQSKTLIFARAGAIAGLYVALTYALVSLAYGNIQVRLSEGLCMLPLVYPESIIGLFVGCALSNIASPFGIYDVILGSAVTLVASGITYLIGKFVKKTWLKILLGGLPPVILNATLLPLIWLLVGGEVGYLTNFISLLISQTLSVYAIGAPLYLFVKKLKDKGVKGF